MASSSTDAPLTREEIVEQHAQLEQLRVTMASRQASGKSTSGRYKKHDSARKVFIDTIAVPSLRRGKRIPAADWKRLFGPGPDEITGPEAADMDKWYALHKKDPRDTSVESYQLDERKQCTLLAWVANNPAAYVRPQPAPSGAPPSYKLSERVSKEYAGFTLAQLAADGTKKQLVPEARVRAGQTLIWIASEQFVWRFPEHLDLFLGLLNLERKGVMTVGNPVGQPVQPRPRRVAALRAALRGASSETRPRQRNSTRRKISDVLGRESVKRSVAFGICNGGDVADRVVHHTTTHAAGNDAQVYLHSENENPGKGHSVKCVFWPLCKMRLLATL